MAVIQVRRRGRGGGRGKGEGGVKGGSWRDSQHGGIICESLKPGEVLLVA